MARYTIEDTKRLRELEGELNCVRESNRSALEWIAPALHVLLDTEKALTLSYEPRAAGLTVIRGATVGISPEIFPFLERWLATAPARWAAYDPVHPELSQRNVVMARDDLKRFTAIETLPVVVDVYPNFGLAGDDMLRVVICDGPSLLGYVSVYQSSTFDKRQKRMFARIVSPLGRRLSKERLLTTAESTRQLLDASLNHIAAATFIVSEGGTVLEANGVGKLWLERNGITGRRAIHDAISSSQEPSNGRFHVTCVASRGVAMRYLVVEAATAGNFDSIRSEGVRWGLTRREIEVLVALADGMPTRTIAAHMSISDRTVEAHLTSMFEKAQVETRAELVTKAMRG